MALCPPLHLHMEGSVQVKTTDMHEQSHPMGFAGPAAVAVQQDRGAARRDRAGVL